MTSPVSAIEAIEKAIEHATPGPWDVWEEQTPTKAEAVAEMAYQVENSEPFAEVVYLLNANGKCPATTGCGPTSAANAAYIAACNPVAMREVLALARQAEALQRRAEEAEALAERMKREAQSHAQEARTANSTIYEIYQVASGGKGEPGNWHGAKPVREKLGALQRENAELRKKLDACDWYWPEEDTSSDACADGPWQIAENYDLPPGEVMAYSRGGVVETRYYAYLPPADDADSDDQFEVDAETNLAVKQAIEAEIARRARALLGGENAE